MVRAARARPARRRSGRHDRAAAIVPTGPGRTGGRRRLHGLDQRAHRQAREETDRPVELRRAQGATPLDPVADPAGRRPQLRGRAQADGPGQQLVHADPRRGPYGPIHAGAAPSPEHLVRVRGVLGVDPACRLLVMGRAACDQLGVVVQRRGAIAAGARARCGEWRRRPARSGSPSARPMRTAGRWRRRPRRPGWSLGRHLVEAIAGGIADPTGAMRGSGPAARRHLGARTGAGGTAGGTGAARRAAGPGRRTPSPGPRRRAAGRTRAIPRPARATTVCGPSARRRSTTGRAGRASAGEVGCRRPPRSADDRSRRPGIGPRPGPRRRAPASRRPYASACRARADADGGSRRAGVLEQQRVERDAVDGEPVRHRQLLLSIVRQRTPASTNRTPTGSTAARARPQGVQQRPDARAQRLADGSRGGPAARDADAIAEPGQRRGRRRPRPARRRRRRRRRVRSRPGEVVGPGGRAAARTPRATSAASRGCSRRPGGRGRSPRGGSRRRTGSGPSSCGRAPGGGRAARPASALPPTVDALGHAAEAPPRDRRRSGGRRPARRPRRRRDSRRPRRTG